MMKYPLIPFMNKTFKITDIDLIQLRIPTMSKGGYFIVVLTKTNKKSKFEIPRSYDTSQLFNDLGNTFNAHGISVEQVNKKSY